MIMSLVIIPIISLFNMAAEGTVKGKNVTIGVNLLREVLETVRNMPFELLDSELKIYQEFPCDGEWYEDVTQYFPESYFPSYWGKFDMRVEIEPLTGEGETHRGDPSKIKRIFAEVRWYTRASKQEQKRTLALGTLVVNQVVDRNLENEDLIYTCRDDLE